MLGKHQKEIIRGLKNNLKRNLIVKKKSSSNILLNDKNKKFNQFIIRLRNKVKINLLSFFKSK